MSQLSQHRIIATQADNAERILITILATGATVSIVYYFSPSSHIFSLK